jgi:hypothetical protein
VSWTVSRDFGSGVASPPLGNHSQTKQRGSSTHGQNTTAQIKIGVGKTMASHTHASNTGWIRFLPLDVCVTTCVLATLMDVASTRIAAGSAVVESSLDVLLVFTAGNSGYNDFKYATRSSGLSRRPNSSPVNCAPTMQHTRNEGVQSAGRQGLPRLPQLR